MDTKTFANILRNIFVVEGKEYTPEFIENVLTNKPITVTIEEAIYIYNRVQAINRLVESVGHDRVTYLFAADLCVILGKGIETDNDLRKLRILTQSGCVNPLSRTDVVSSLRACMNTESPQKQAAALFKFFVTELPYTHSNEALGYLCACKAILDSGNEPMLQESASVLKAAIEDLVHGERAPFESLWLREAKGASDTIVYEGKVYNVADVVAVVPPTVRKSYSSDYECAKQYVAEYAKQIVL